MSNHYKDSTIFSFLKYILSQLLCSRFYCRNWGFKRKAGQTTTRASCNQFSSKCGSWGNCAAKVLSSWHVLPFLSHNKSLKLRLSEQCWVLLAGQHHPWGLRSLRHPASRLERPTPLRLEPPPPPGSSWCRPQGSSRTTALGLCVTHADPAPSEGAPCWLCSQARHLGAEIQENKYLASPVHSSWWMHQKMKN